MRTIGLSNILRGSNKSLCASGEADAGIKAEPAGRRKSRPFSPIDGRRFGESPEFWIFTPRPRKKGRSPFHPPSRVCALIAEQGRGGVERQIASWLHRCIPVCATNRAAPTAHTSLLIILIFYPVYALLSLPSHSQPSLPRTSVKTRMASP